MTTTPARTLIIGSGAREHALAWKLAAEPGVDEVVVAPGSSAIAAEARVRCLPVDPLDPPAVVAAAREAAADLVVIGPEAPLAAGVVDALADAGFRVFGPTQAAARIESSKAFCHAVADAAGVRMARARAFEAGEEAAARAYVAELGVAGHGVVLKQDGLAAGKGVTVYEDVGLALDHVDSYLAAGRGPGPVLVVEERLLGREASVIAICDGREAIALPVSRDHKRLCDGDLGPNTGGMGAYSPLPDLADDEVDTIIQTVHRPLLAELARRGAPFVGFLYAGLMLTTDGPILLECNARLGDPEAQVILPRLAGALGPVLAAAAARDLADAPLAVHPGAAVGIVLASEGYPGTPKRGLPIEGLEAVATAGALVFHGGSIGRPGGGFGTTGGRVLTVVGRGADLPAARHAAEQAANLVSWDGMQRRHDIAAVLPPEPSIPVGAGS